MALNGQEFAFHMSVASGYLAAQSDPNQSLGGYRSSTRVDELESTVTTQVSVFVFRDSTQTGVSHVGKWVVFVTGNNAIDARRIIHHDTAIGDIGVSPAWGNAPLVAEVYRISGAANLFDDVDAQECSGGHVDHRMVYLLNSTGVPLNDGRCYLLPLDPYDTNMELACGNGSKGANQVTPTFDEEEAPDLDTLGITGFTASKPQRFRAARDYVTAEEVPYNIINFVNNGGYPIWIRRTIPALTKRADDAAWLLVVEQDTGVKTAVPIVFNTTGYTPQLAASFDRTPRTFGGARIEMSVVDADFGFAIEDEEIYAAIDTGPGTLNSAPQPLETDEDGEAYAVYISPEDDGQAGATVSIEVKMGGDP
jgi:hypothetical protein